MKQIRKYNEDTGRYEAISAGYSGLSQGDAMSNIKQLRKWARADHSNAKYKIVDVTLVPV